jgi:hypothetical protein
MTRSLRVSDDNQICDSIWLVILVYFQFLNDIASNGRTTDNMKNWKGLGAKLSWLSADTIPAFA